MININCINSFEPTNPFNCNSQSDAPDPDCASNIESVRQVIHEQSDKSKVIDSTKIVDSTKDTFETSKIDEFTCSFEAFKKSDGWIESEMQEPLHENVK
jgi:uncharacterized protein (UPF0179 family)